MNDNLLFQSQDGDDLTCDCFGHSFPNLAELQEHYLRLLEGRLDATREQYPHSFPSGKREQLLSLAQAPWYTPCPNPFTKEFVEYYRDLNSQKPHGRTEPFTADVTEGKGDAVYNAHAYHTKVPHKALMRYILHFTEPGDIVFDGFCGTGMTGVAAQLCNSRKAVEALGYSVSEDGFVKDSGGSPISQVGARPVILCDLSTAATFISSGYNLPPEPDKFIAEAEEHLALVCKKWDWMFSTIHEPTESKVANAIEAMVSLSDNDLNGISEVVTGRIHYVVWSDIFICPECSNELVFWEEAVDQDKGKVHTSFPCPHCNASLTKRRLNLAMTTVVDPFLKTTVEIGKQAPDSSEKAG